ncbi:uncharacterized protein BCR38DRAFT_510284 [Pseudomassariella vexata]|uniref:Uncharacterized protein n=1 Tax=Pseudomassariella vexata TaxID=1141098 RepID=A0A1Y2E811_9PEZI|nr:uncharacterized protein BCR38DRAFT_510284 [Pseudomassariella vexata]ORY67416.1 hypothetical protein BCR38DRAFT_510284 [Pseudomassariella vexata]
MSYANEPIAIIGSGCRFPGGASSPSKLWELLKQPRDVAKKIDRFQADSFYHQDGHHHGTSNVLHSYLLEEDTKAFDAQFFNISGAEADAIDPQQRFLMEVVYEALESSGLKIEDLSGTAAAVYVGVMCNDYAQITYQDLECVHKYAATGTASSILSNRVSYFFNWTGPSMTIDTACSSSLIATHQAVQVLRSGESNLAVAAGTNLIFSPTNFVAESNVNMLSPTGRSRMWSANGDGYARGEGTAAVILKRLSDAIADGDNIECIIRETGTNQDGRTPGITMPSSSSQAQLIRQTYAKAGLDLIKDRCQYFEAHGTGTKAGDPQEAGAIFKAFYGDKEVRDPDDVLYVGSIKTVIGHTEGTAGVAGLLKASLSIQNGVIPPNMLFDELNPDIEPYYGNLQITTAPKPWPELAPGVPRRASVNSFGFGGANAHAILENYEPVRSQQVQRSSLAAMPFLFSANSEKTLASQLETYLSFLENTTDVENTNLRDLAWTLSRKSGFSLRTTCSATTIDSLRSKLSTKLEAKKNDNKPLGVRPSMKNKKILGVFTGQGAQWPMMGYRLIESSSFARKIVDQLDESLQSLPEQDRPTWSIKEELAKGSDESHVMEAAYSQPLCTAVQVLLVDMLSKAGVSFDAMVGHSSGEIAAAYAAGYLTASDAVRVAYYRGLYSKLASGPGGVAGGMLAVATSLEDAQELCDLPTFQGRLNVAASNSSSSITLSGDIAAIEEAKFILEDESKFVRALKVDTAYHSHHMQPCAEVYIEAMRRCKVEIQTPKTDCKWFSSVLGGTEVSLDMAEELAGTYWRDNLLQPVLFSQALEAALDHIGTPGLAVEVGAHPALKAPASGTIEEKCGSSVPYCGVLARGSNDVEALSEGIGAIWSNIGSAAVNFAEFDILFSEGPNDKPKFLKTTPTYTWDHDHTYWNESRMSKSMRFRPEGHHELLGIRTDGGENEYRWRNFIKPAEMGWMRGHQIQGQIIYPGSGYVAMAMEACKVFAPASQIAQIEVLNLRITRAMAFLDDAAVVETLVNLANVQHDEERGLVSCDFVCEICPNKDAPPATASTCQIRLRLGEGSHRTLPERCQSTLKMTEVDREHFYSSLSTLGYNYADMFQGITTLKRTTDTASGVIHIEPEEGYDSSSLIFHPAPLDVAFQSVFGAIGSPGDGRLINPYSCPQGAGLGSDLPFDAVISVSPSNGISGDIEGLHDDAQMISETIWGPDVADVTKDFTEFWDETEERWGLAYFIERACFFYMKRLHDTISAEEREKCEWHPRKYLNWVASIVEEVSEGTHPIAKKEWINDTWEALEQPMREFAAKYDDFHHIMDLGDNLVPFVRGEVNLLETVRESLEYIYKHTFGFPEYNAYLGGLVEQLSHKHRQMDILEIGAGTGSATEAIMQRIGDNYSSYTYTDISAGFFMDAEEIFKAQSDKFIYKTLDVEKNPVEQGYVEHSYDLIVASNVLHATTILENTLSNVHKLLKPGGYLVLLETTDVNPLRPTFFFGSLPGWWIGEADGRLHHPLITQKGWETVLQKAGFSGIDTATPDTKVFMVPQSIIMSQAVDTQIKLIRQPLSGGDKIKLDNLLILGGGQSLSTCQLQEDVIATLQPFTNSVTIVDRLEDLTESQFVSKQIILSLLELDEPVFNPFTPEKWACLQLLTEKARNVCWILQGSRGENPYANMMIGVSRCLVYEKSDLRIQCIDYDINDSPDPTYIAGSVLRMHISDTWKGFIEPYNPTWVLEREIRVLDGGEISIPRVMPCKRLDNRYNASRRTIRDELQLTDSVVEVTNEGSAFELQEVTTPSWATSSLSDSVDIEVHRSSLFALPLLSLAGTQEKVMAFSETCRSKVTVDHDQDASLVITAASAPKGTSILVHEPTKLIAEALQEAAKERGVTVTFTTSDETKTEFRVIHPAAPARALWQALPNKLSGFMDMSSGCDAGRVGARIEKQIPSRCERVPLAILFSGPASVQPDASVDSVANILRKANGFFASHADLDTTERVEEVALADIPGHVATSDSFAVANWTSQPTASAKLSTPENIIQFRSDKTYFLVGLSGDLGLSLCQWMVRRGARYVVLTSRNPKVDPNWMKLMDAEGAVVSVMAMDVTDKRAVLKCYQTICKTLPPIVGVINGAMVLNDGLVATQSYDDFNGTLRPKVEGTRFLNEIFNKPTLDFFIVFSSLAYSTGNIGQSSYAAANAYMVSIVEGRRKRGLVGSAMNLAGIYGIGYITRTDRNIVERLQKLGYSSISEWDYLQFFAEAVLAGQPDSLHTFEVSSSLKPSDPEADSPPAWLGVPRFSYFKRVRAHVAGGEDGKMVSVRNQLKEQTTKEGVYKVLLAGLTANLYKQLGMRPEDNGIAPSTSLVELGIDSLVAVDMRFWFTRELDLDVPVLKLLGGATLDDMVEDTIGRLSPELVPNVKELQAAPQAEATEANTEANTETDTSSTTDEVPESDDSTPANSSAESDDASWSEISTPNSTPASDNGKQLVEQPLAIERKIKMSYSSLQFWFLCQYLEDPTPFNLSFRLALRGKIDISRLEQAVLALGRRHEAFRTAFFADADNNDEPTQAVLAESPLRLETLQIANADEAVAVNKSVNGQVFNLDRGHTIRILLLSENERPNHHHLLFSFHHIAMDGYSLNLLLSDLNALYEGRRLLPVTAQLTDVMRKQRQAVEDNSLASEFKFWKQTLGVVPDPIPLFPMAKVQARMPVTKYQFSQVPMAVLDEKTVKTIKDQCRAMKATKFQFFMAVLRIFLFKLVDPDDLCIGMLDANRADSSSNNTIGCLLNLLPLKFENTTGQKFADVVRDVRAKAYAALANSRVPFNALLERLDVPRSSTYSPVFQVVMNYIGHKWEQPKGLGTPEGEIVAHLGHNFYDVLIDVNDLSEKDIRIRLQAQSYLYSESATQMLLDGFVRLVKLFATGGASTPVEKAELYDPIEVKKALTMGRGEL